MAALLQQPDILKNAYEDAQNAEGSAWRENEKYLDSIQGRIDLFTNSVQTMWSNAINDDVVKWFIDFGKTLVDLVNDIGLIRTAFIALGTYLNMKYLKIDFSKFFNVGNIKKIPSILKSVTQSVKQFATEWKTIGTKGVLKKGFSSIISKLGEKVDMGEGLQSNLDQAKLTFLTNPLDEANKQNLDAAQTAFDKYNQLLTEQRAKIQGEIDIAQQDLQTAKENLKQYGGDTEGLKKYQDAVDEAKRRVEELDNKQRNLGKTGTRAFSKLSAGVKAFVENLTQALSSMAMMYLISEIISLIQMGFDALIKTSEEAKEEFDDLSSKLASTESKLKDLQSQFNDIQDKIEEISNNTPLSFTDQEELDRLKEQSAELEREINLTEKLKEQQQKDVNSSASENIENYKKAGSTSGETFGDKMSSRAGKYAGVGAGVGVVSGVGTGIVASIVSSGSVGAAIGSAIPGLGTVIGLAIGALVGLAMAAVVSGIETAADDSVEESLDNMKSKYDNLQKEYQEAQKKYIESGDEDDYEDLENAQKNLYNYEAQMAGNLTQLKQWADSIDWETATDEEKKQKANIEDQLDKWAIISGDEKAKENMFDRLFGDEAFVDKNISEAVKNAKQAYIDALNSGKSITLEEAFGSNTEAYNEFKERVHSMNGYIVEAEQYLKDYKKAAEQASKTNLYDLANSLETVEDGLSSLKSAFEEVSESGQISAKTIKELNDTFGSVENISDEWTNYANVMMSGVASTKEMIKVTEELAEAWLDEALSDGELTITEKVSIVSGLTRMGVNNAYEYVEDAQKEAGYQKMADVVSSKMARKSELESKEGLTEDEQTELEQLTKDLDFSNPQSLQYLTDIADKYGIANEELQKYIDGLKDLAEIQKEIEETSKEKQSFQRWNTIFGEVIEKFEDFEGFDKKYAFIGKYKGSTKHLDDALESWQVYGEYLFSDNVITKEFAELALTDEDEEFLKSLTEEERDIIFNFKGNFEDILPDDVDYTEFMNLLSLYNDAIEEGKTKGYFETDEYGNIKTDDNGKYIIKPEFAEYEVKLDKLEAQKEDILNELETEYTADIQVELDLINASTEVDEIQEVYDTLNSAMEEYREQGYFNVDTVQSLLGMDGKYIDLLYDENGQLNLNEESLYKVAQARLYNLGLQKLEAIGTAALNVAQKGSVDKMNDLIKVYDSASDSMTDYIATQKQAIIVALNARNDLTQEQKDSFVNGIESQMNAVYKTTMSAVNNIRGAISSSDKSSSETAKDEFDKIVAKFERELNLISHEKDLIQAEIDKTEARGEIASVSYYERLIELEEMQKQKLIEKKEALEDYLKTHEKSVDKATWAEMNGEIQDTALAIKDCEKNIIDFGQAIEDVHWSYFEKANDEVNGLADEIQWLNSLLEDTKDVADENGNWSSNAITQLGLYVQQMEYAAAMTKRYGEEINNVDAAWKEYQQLLTQYGDSNNIPDSAKEQLTNKYNVLIQSESEYQEKLKELEDAQRSSIDSYKDAKDGIVSLNEARVDAIKDGIDKEIDAYKELIDLKKEELDAEKDLYDFKKNVEKQTKDISELERKISSLSGSTSDADIAERRKLEAQLKESQEGLNDIYYDHAKEAQSNALDEEMEAYQDARDKYIEQLDEMLKDVEQLIQDTLMDVLFNADLISQELIILEQTYGITLSEELKKPWQDASTQATAWKDELQESMTSGEYAALIGEGGAITVFSNQVGQKLKGSWDQAKSGVKEYADFLNGTELKDRFTSTLTGFGNQIQSIIDKWKGVKKAAEQAAQAQIEAASGDYTIGGYDGNVNPGGGPIFDPTTPEKQKKRYYKYKKIGSYYFYECGSDASGNSYSGYYIRRSNRIPYGAKLVATAEETLYTYRQNSNQMVAAIQKNGETKKHPVIYCGVNGYVEEYAKGTISTKKDQWAITDEPQWGDELTLVPGKDGNLSFMRKGTGVVPAKLTERIMELAMQNPSDMSGTIVKPIVSDIKTNANAINVNFEALVKADNITNDVLPEVEKIVSKQLDKFTRSLNYSLRKVGAN